MSTETSASGRTALVLAANWLRAAELARLIDRAALGFAA
jgi:hypothetical protein